MSTQPSSFPSTVFSITHPQQNLRLLELPPDLLDLLTSEAKPKTLELKSASTKPNITSKGQKSRDEFLHLCTKDKVWAVRQVSTSNSVYITIPTLTATLPMSKPEPTASTSDPDSDTMAIDSSSVPKTTLTAISQPTSTLELIPVPLTTTTIESAIRDLISIYHLSPSPASSSFSPSTSSHSLSTLFSSLPYPTPLLKRAARTLFTFEVHAPKSATLQAFIPSPALLLHSYKLLKDFLSAPLPAAHNNNNAVDLSTLDVIGAGDTLTFLAQEEGEVYACVANAILEKFVVLDLHGQDEEEYREEYSLEGKLDGKALGTWLGGLLVRCACEDNIGGKAEGAEEGELLEQWKDLMPKAWWEWCTLESLVREQGCIVVDGKVRLVETQASNMTRDGGKGGASASSTAAACGKRKWHERFAKEREKR